MNHSLTDAVIHARKDECGAMEPLADDDPAEIAAYRLSARLGSGGMGRVYLAFTRAGRPVAVKVVRPEFSGDEEFRHRFRQEVAAALRVHGLYTAEVLDADPDASPPWLVTAYVPGPSLQQAVAEHGPMPPQTVLALVAGVAEALQAIHGAGVVHRDLKPSNVLLAADGPRVIDFGIARAAEATAMTRTGMRVGSPQFMAPEQAEGRPVSPATDVFALGSLAMFAATGRPPFGDGSEAAILYRIVHQEPDLAGCQPPLRELIGRCLAKDAAERPSPDAIIGHCRERTAGPAAPTAEPWLPPAVAADLVNHAAPATLPATLAAPPGQPATPLAAALPGVPAPDPDGSGQRLRWRVRRRTLAGGLALAALVAAGIGTFLLMPHDVPAKPKRGTAASAALRSRHSASRQRTQPATGGPSPSATGAACLIGTWKGVTENILNTINGSPTEFTGSGTTEVFRPNGTIVITYSHGGDSTVDSANVNGIEWTFTITGRATANWTAQNGSLLISGISADGGWTMRDDGAFNNSGPLGLEPGPWQYTCSGNTLREFFADGSSVDTRLSVAGPASPAGS
jgi:hypothetical protein